jgi:hypothetical protein
VDADVNEAAAGGPRPGTAATTGTPNAPRRSARIHHKQQAASSQSGAAGVDEETDSSDGAGAEDCSDGNGDKKSGSLESAVSP